MTAGPPLVAARAPTGRRTAAPTTRWLRRGVGSGCACVAMHARSRRHRVDAGRRDARRVPRARRRPGRGTRRFLGVIDDVPYFAVTVEEDDGRLASLREFGGFADDLDAALVVSAVALEQWHQRHTHCPRCGAPTVETQAGWTRTCTADGSDHFPRTDPAVIMLIHDGGDRALLGRGPQWGEGRFSTLAGFVEPGESLEAAVAREVYEEVGVAITDIDYVASQPWPFPASLMVGFTAGWTATRRSRSTRSRWPRPPGSPARRSARPGLGGHPHAAEGTARLQGISPRLSISRYLIDRWLDA